MCTRNLQKITGLWQNTKPVLCLCGICYYVFMNMLIYISVDVFVYSLSVYFWQAPTCDMWVPWWFTDWGPHINCTMGKYKIHINWTIGKCKIHIHWEKYKIHINWRTGLVHLAKQGSLSQSWDQDILLSDYQWYVRFFKKETFSSRLHCLNGQKKTILKPKKSLNA